MKKLITILATFLFLINQKIFSINKLSSNLEYVGYKTKSVSKNNSKPKILTVCSLGGRGGTEMNCIWQHKALIDAGYDPIILVRRDTPLQDAVIQHRISHYVTDAGTKVPSDALIGDIREICVKEKVDLIQAHIFPDFELSAIAVSGLKTKIVFYHNSYRSLDRKELSYATGIITVNKKISENLKEKKFDSKKIIQHIFPFFDEKKFINYDSPKISRNDFLESIGIFKDKNLPIVSMVGNFYSPEEKPNESFIFEKNQELLIKVLHHFVYQKQKPFHVVFAGSGPSKKWHEDLSSKLGLSEYAHFLGHCQDTRPLLFFSNFHILSSACEASGIAHIEAGLMKKITIGATETGATEVIIHGKTGFIFKNNNLSSLIEILELLLDNPQLCKEMGNQTLPFLTGKIDFDGIKSKFSTKFKFKLLEDLYKKVLKINPNKKNPVVRGKIVHLDDKIKSYESFVRPKVEEYYPTQKQQIKSYKTIK